MTWAVDHLENGIPIIIGNEYRRSRESLGCGISSLNPPAQNHGNHFE